MARRTSSSGSAACTAPSSTAPRRMAAGLDRIVMLLCGTTNLREISLFPMNQQAVDLLMGAPSEVTTKQLRELHIRLNLPGKGSGIARFRP
jgi:aspartyl-tRNA synthetase